MPRAVGTYLIALIAVAVAFALHWIAGPLLANTLPLVTLFAAVALAVAMGGYRPALVAMAGGLLVCIGLVCWPAGPGHPSPGRSFYDFAVYAFTSLAIIGLGEYLRSTRHSLELQQRQSEMAMRRAEESERRFRLLADTAPVLIWVSGRDKLRTWLNRRWLDFVGRSMELDLGNGWSENVHPDDLPRCLRVHAEAFDAQQPFTMQYRMRRHDGQYRWIVDNGTPLHDLQGEFNGYIGTALDIEDHKRQEEALRLADRRKDEFLATLSHELRNPLAPIRSAVEIFKRKELADDDLRRSREIIERQVGRISRLLEDLLDLSRISHNKLVLRHERVDLGAVLRDAVQSFRGHSSAGRHEVTVATSGAAVPVVADPVRLGQVFGNLLDNAGKYSDPGRPIAVGMRAVDGWAVVSVRDQGIGIEAAMLERVFDMFAQSVPALERSQGGLGIGLALSRRIVELHGGSLKASSAGPGKGAEFVVRLPIDDGSGAA